MKRALMIGSAAVVLTSGIALAQPDSLLPDIYSNPAPTPAPTAVAPAPAPTVVPPDPTVRVEPTVQALPGYSSDGVYVAPIDLPEDFPTIEEIEEMTSDEIDELFGLRPRFDIPAGARRALRRVGVVSLAEGGFPSQSLAGQPATLIRGALGGIRFGMVSRWGHILMRRTLASRLDAPRGMDPVEFAALRAAALNTMGEAEIARALVQDVDSSNFDASLTDAAFEAYLATGDIVGMCPVARLKRDIRNDPQWQLLRSICSAYGGDGRDSTRELDQALNRELAPSIDVLLAQRYAGAASDGGRAVTIEWDDAPSLNRFRYSLAVALGLDVPDGLRAGAGAWYDRLDAYSPARPLVMRARYSDRSAREGILSSRAMVDLYAQVYALDGVDGEEVTRSVTLREAYVAGNEADRVSAMRQIWGSGDPDYGRLVLTAYAAARITPSEDHSDDAALLVASMLSAGLDRNAMRWGAVVPAGSEAWALLTLAQISRDGNVDNGGIDSFVDDDASPGSRKSQFLVAGLAGLGRIDNGTANGFANRLGMDLARESNWSRMITLAAEVENPALVSLLAGVGMQGDDWAQMTPRHLYVIVRSLNAVGLSAEARMIAAEAVARG